MIASASTATHGAPILRELTDKDIEWGLLPAPETAPCRADDLIVDALIDAQSYRILAYLAIHHAHGLHVDLEQLRGQHARLVDDYRALRLMAGASE